jgi:preprotein translocase subunit SecE
VVKKETATKEVELGKAEGGKLPLKGFVEETQEELGKVVWPSRQQLISESAAVMLMVTLVASAIYLVDKFFAWGAAKLFS